MTNLQGRRILVTGASSGIGRAVAQEAALCGASLILLGRDNVRLNATYDSLLGFGHEFYSIDITDYSHVEEIIRSSVSNFGFIDGFVHSAGIEKTIPFNASSPKLFKEVFEVNVFAGFEIARLLSKKGIVNPLGASHVFISSASAVVGEPGKVIYCSSKSALTAGVKALAIELAIKKIRCNCVLPGCVDTDMLKKIFASIPTEAKQLILNKHPLGIGQPEDVAFLVCFLISDKAKWITGCEYIIDGGYSV
uniref:SDR family NAD(P)-dependent oxidoreductase n=1 Tax=Algoriphagus sp. TaxID=1872435 RepID=UPI00404772CE